MFRFSHKFNLAILLGAAAFLSGCGLSGKGVARVEEFKTPSIKDDFCGVVMDFRYCKCAFHGDYCKEINLSKKQANAEINKRFDEWTKEKIASWGEACTAVGGAFRAEEAECAYCESGYRAEEGVCEETDNSSDVKPLAVDKDIFDKECKLVADIFDRDWKKYSDIDSRIDYADRSFEAKKVLDSDEEMITLMVEGFALERDNEVDKGARADLEEYKKALTQNIKTNLLKSFWRLAWITYSTMDSGKGLGTTYAGLLEGVENIGSVAKGIQLIQGVVPNDSTLAIDTGSFSGKVKSVSVNTALEAVGSLGDPVSTATEFLKNSATVNFPSADITSEELALLKEQHLKNGAIDAAIKESMAREATREARMAEIETKISGLKAEIASWEAKEKERVRGALEESCSKTK